MDGRIIHETTRYVGTEKLRWPNSLTAHLEAELRAHFSEAWITGYESLVPRMTNEKKDRHVAAAAVHAEAIFATSVRSIWSRGVSGRCTLNGT